MKPAFNPFDPAVTECPFDHYADMHAEGGVARLPMGIFVIAGHELIQDALRDTETFSSDFGRLGGSFQVGAFGAVPEAVASVLDRGHPFVPTLLTCDPPAHQRYRSLVGTAFTPRRVAGLTPRIEEVATRLVDGFAHQGSADVVTDFAVPFPLVIIADELGVGHDHLARFKRWSDDSVAALGGFLPVERQVEIAQSVIELQHYFEERIAERRGGEHDDLLGALVHAGADGVEPLSTPEILSIVQQILVAGNETTTKLVASGVDILVDRPELQDALRGDDTLIAAFVEEVLRTESPLQGMLRIVTKEVTLAGVDIPAGSLAIVMYGAANRDPAVFDDPDAFRLDRDNLRAHLAFGKGEHFCIGAGLARAEAVIAFRVLLDRLPGLRRGPGPRTREPSLLLRGFAALPVEFDAVPVEFDAVTT